MGKSNYVSWLGSTSPSMFRCIEKARRLYSLCRGVCRGSPPSKIQSVAGQSSVSRSESAGGEFGFVSSSGSRKCFGK